MGRVQPMEGRRLYCNTYIELTSLLFLAYIAFRFFASKRFPDRKNKYFGICLVLGLFEIIISLVPCLLQNRMTWLLGILIGEVHFISRILLAASLFNYALLMSGLLYRHARLSIAIQTAIAALLALAIASNAFNGWLFFYDSGMNYNHGFYRWLYFIPYAAYMTAASVISIARRRHMSIMRFITVPLYCIFAAFCIMVEILFPDFMLTGFVFSAALMIIYLNIQNPGNELDPLTKAYSRDIFSLFIDELHDQGKSYPIIYANIVGTSSFNKTIGESRCNELIKKTSERLCALSPWNLVFRYTGDSFVMIVRDVPHLKEMEDRLIKGVSEESLAVAGSSIMVQLRMFCIQASEAKAPSETINRIIELAIKRLHSFKPNTITTLDKSYIINIQHAVEVEDALKRAIETNSVEIFLQPVIDSDTRRIVSAEALARINDRKLGMIPPGAFIPIAEETGMISSLTLQVVNRVCMFLKSIPFDCHRRLKWVSINLSISDCMSRSQVEKICNIISSYGISPRKIAFEITETMATISKGLSENLLILASKGFVLALDDFGTEYANIDSALRFPFSLAKLDKSVIHISASGDKMKILTNMVGIFSDMHLETVAEGIDSQSVMDIAKAAGVRYMQGFFFSKPLPVNVFINSLIQNREQEAAT